MFDLNKLNEQQVLSLYTRIQFYPHPVEDLSAHKLLPEGRDRPSADTRDARVAFLRDYLDAKKEFHRSHSELVYEDFNKVLAGRRDGNMFVRSAENRDTIAKMLDCDLFNHGSVNPEHFVEALHKTKEDLPRYVDILINQARELAYITDKPLAEAMKERLLHAGLTPFQADVLTDVTHAYENNTHEHFLQELKRIHGPEAARFEAPTAPVNAGERAAAENLASQESNAARASHAAGSSAWKWGFVAATVAVGAVIGYWVWKSKHKGKEKQASQNRAASGVSL